MANASAIKIQSIVQSTPCQGASLHLEDLNWIGKSGTLWLEGGGRAARRTPGFGSLHWLVKDYEGVANLAEARALGRHLGPYGTFWNPMVFH